MTTMTLQEAEAQLLTVNAAIQQLLEKKGLIELTVGSGSFRRTYKYADPGMFLEKLRDLRTELLQVISTLSPVEMPNFRTNTTIPMVVKKDRYGVES